MALTPPRGDCSATQGLLLPSLGAWEPCAPSVSGSPLSKEYMTPEAKEVRSGEKDLLGAEGPWRDCGGL